jgi:hypothetical protein
LYSEQHNEEWVIGEIKEEINRYMEVKENENTTYQNLWDIAKDVLRGKFIAMSSYIKRSERSQIKDLILQLKFLEKQEQANPKRSRGREIIKIRAEINKIEKKYKQSMKQKPGPLKNNKFNRPQANFTKIRREKPQISKIRNAKGERTQWRYEDR